jgi:hypothetical protein
MNRQAVQPIYITVETGGALYVGDVLPHEHYRVSLLSKIEPYPYGTWVDVNMGRGPDDEAQWVPHRAINHRTDRFGQLWIKVTNGADGEEEHKFLVRSQFVRKREFAIVDWPEGTTPESVGTRFPSEN